MSNLATVQSMYAAFGAGNIPAIINQLDDQVAWDKDVYANNVPWLQPYQGKQQVVQFFESLAGLEFHKFEPKTFLEQGNIVVVLVDIDATIKKNGKRNAEKDEVHIWEFNQAGKVVSFQHKVDTNKQVQLYNA